MYYETLRTEGSRTGKPPLVFFIAGDDEEAKAIVSTLTEEIVFEPVNPGSLVKAGASSSWVQLSITIRWLPNRCAGR